MAYVFSIESIFGADFLDKQEVLEGIKKLSVQNDVYVTDRYKNRLDNISYDCYGKTDLWWVLAVFNDIIDPMEFDNQSIKVPYLQDINSLLVNYQV